MGDRDIDSAAPRGLTPRRLAAIVAGDIAGHSRLMEFDEEGTHARVKRIQRDLIEPSIAEHYGRLVKTTGDGFIAIFDSPLEAVRCGIVIQQNMSGRNTSLPTDQRIQYRIGINLGDVIIEEDDIYGDGVNVASRLESIADPGGVFILGGIYEQIKHKPVCGYESLDDRKVKNITDPVSVYRVLPDPTAFSKVRTRRRRENAMIFLLSFILLGIAGGALWYTLQQHGRARDHASTPVPPQIPNTLSSPLTGGNQLSQSPQPPPSAAPVAPGATSQAQPTASAAPATKQSALQGAPASRAGSAVREPEMNLLRDDTFMMGSNDDATEKPIHQVTLKPFASVDIRFPCANGTNVQQPRLAGSWQT